jgi:hypothetical protein
MLLLTKSPVVSSREALDPAVNIITEKAQE